MLSYGLVSTAIAEDRERLLEGIRLLAGIAHKHGIPITWAVDTKSAPVVAKLLTTWHTENGDAPLLMLDIRQIWETNWEAERNANPGASTEAMASHLVTMREKLPKHIITERERLARTMPWAELNIAGAVFKNDTFLRALEQIGFRGLWGYHWNQQDVDESDPNVPEIEGTDRGGFGCFYPLEVSASLDAIVARGTTDDNLSQSFEKIVGVPYHTANHLAEDTHNLRAALLNGTAQQHYDVYVDSTAWNQWLGYVEHIDPLAVAHLGQEGLERLDAYFAYVVGIQDTKPQLLSQMVDDYIKHCQKTEPTTVVAVSTEIQGETPKPKSTLNMLYYDAACEFTFVEGAMDPIEIKNYAGERVLQSEVNKPVLTGFLPTRHRTQLHIAIVIESTRTMPYGIAMWGDHEGLQLTESNVDDVRWIGEHSLFIRLTLQSGKNEFSVKLTI